MADPSQFHEEEDVDPPALSFFPDPPPFFKHFTTENIARLKELEDEALGGDGIAAKDAPTTAPTLSADQISALPTELRYLIPPEPPADDDEFHVFNEKAKAKGTHVFDKNMEHISEMLRLEGIFPEGWKYKQLPEESASTAAFATFTHQQKLYSCVRSLLLAYLKLLGIMASNPTSQMKSDTLEDVLNLVTNMHALINEYRPHQARETLIEKMEAQVERKRKEIEGVKQVAERVRVVLGDFSREAEGLQRDDESRSAEQVGAPAEETERTRMQRHMWETMDEILGH
ncbi:hypothetical protein NX059_011271 [Plenodomus lindquistii]|nr:hypothetical protein NX059_011271 [Plenodomus lindquistii]